MKRLLLVLMLILGAVMITSRPVQTYAYTEEQKQQAKSWLSAHGYPPTRAGAEQAYQDYMDGKIDVPEADAYLGRNKQTKIEEKKNSTSTTNKTSQKTGSEDTTKYRHKEYRYKEYRITDICYKRNNNDYYRKNSNNRNERTAETKRREKETGAEKRKEEAYDRNYNCDCGSCSFCDFSIDHA